MSNTNRMESLGLRTALYQCYTNNIDNNTLTKVNYPSESEIHDKYFISLFKSKINDNEDNAIKSYITFDIEIGSTVYHYLFSVLLTNNLYSINDIVTDADSTNSALSIDIYKYEIENSSIEFLLAIKPVNGTLKNVSIKKNILYGDFETLLSTATNISNLDYVDDTKIHHFDFQSNL